MYKKLMLIIVAVSASSSYSANAASDAGAFVKFKKKVEITKYFESSRKAASDAYQKIVGEKETKKTTEKIEKKTAEDVTKIPVAPPPPPVKSVTTPSQPKSLLNQIKGKIEETVKSLKATSVGKVIFKQKTMSEQLKDAVLLREVKELKEKQAGGVLKQDPLDMSPMEKVFSKIGNKVIQAFPNTSKKIFEASIKTQNSSISRLSKKKCNEARDFYEKLKATLFQNIKIKDVDIDAELANRGAEFRAELEAKAQQKLVSDLNEKLKKDVITEFTEKGIKIDNQKIEIEVQKRMVYTFTPEEKSKAELTVRDDVIKSFKDQAKDKLMDDKLSAGISSKIAELEKKAPSKYRKQLEKIGKSMNLKPEQVKKILDDPKSTSEKMHIDAINATYKEQVKDELKKTMLAKITDYAQEKRLQASSLQAMAIAVVCSLVFNKMVAVIQNSVLKLIGSGGVAGGDVRSQSENKTGTTTTQIATTTKVQTIKEESSFDTVSAVVNFYLTFDEYFKEALTNFSYMDRILNAKTTIEYPMGKINAGFVLLFDYEGAGNLANGLTPMIIKMYPQTIGGYPIFANSIIEAINNAVAMELINALQNSSPELIFQVKAISLFNFANKNYSDDITRTEFLWDELDKLFVRLIWTVDENATSRSNALEPNEDKWEPIYIKNVSTCLFNGPECIRNIINNMVLPNVKLPGGNISSVPYEQLIIDRFEEFQILNMLPFEGDVDYDEDVNPIKSTEIKRILFGIFLRALNDVLKLEKDLITKTTPVTLRDATGKEENFIGKTFYTDSTTESWAIFKMAQTKYIDALVEVGADIKNKENINAYNLAEKNYLNAAKAYDISTLNFRKKICTYEVDRTQGLEPETILDFLIRELKRYYNLTKDRTAFESDVLKLFEPFASNFPFTGKDLLNFAKDPSPIKKPKQKTYQQP